MKLLTSLSAAVAEFRRAWILSDWSPGTVYVWPELLHPTDILAVARECGMYVKNVGALERAGSSSRWKLTLDRDPTGVHLAGVATCTNDDRERTVIVLEAA